MESPCRTRAPGKIVWRKRERNNCALTNLLYASSFAATNCLKTSTTKSRQNGARQNPVARLNDSGARETLVACATESQTNPAGTIFRAKMDGSGRTSYRGV